MTPPVISDTYNYGGNLYNDIYTTSVCPGKEVSWVASPVGAAARSFVVGPTNGVNFTNEWTTMVIELTGCPASTAVVNIEFFINVEFQLNTSTAVPQVINRLSTNPPPRSDLATTAAQHAMNTVGNVIEGGVKTVETAVYNAASSALNTFLDDPLTSLAALFA